VARDGVRPDGEPRRVGEGLLGLADVEDATRLGVAQGRPRAVVMRRTTVSTKTDRPRPMALSIRSERIFDFLFARGIGLG
jgi:hypothetical protein